MHQGQCSNLEKRRSRHATTSIFICCFAPRLLAVAARKSQQIILQNIKFVYLSILRPIKCKAGLRSSAQLIIQHTSKKSLPAFFASCKRKAEIERTQQRSTSQKTRTKKNIYIFFFELLNGFSELKTLDISDFSYSILKIYSILSEHILSFDLSSFMHSKYYSSNHGY